MTSILLGSGTGALCTSSCARSGFNIGVLFPEDVANYRGPRACCSDYLLPTRAISCYAGIREYQGFL